MKKSEMLGAKLDRAETLLGEIRNLVKQVIDADENGDGVAAGNFFSAADELSERISEVGYDVLLPMEMEEEEADRLAEIDRLKARLAQLGA